jgi:hypothetical protein
LLLPREAHDIAIVMVAVAEYVIFVIKSFGKKQILMYILSTISACCTSVWHSLEVPMVTD